MLSGVNGILRIPYHKACVTIRFVDVKVVWQYGDWYDRQRSGA